MCICTDHVLYDDDDIGRYTYKLNNEIPFRVPSVTKRPTCGNYKNGVPPVVNVINRFFLGGGGNLHKNKSILK